MWNNSVYKIQDIKDHEFEDIMTDMLDNIILDYDRYLVMGDVNFSMLHELHESNSVSHICDLFDLKISLLSLHATKLQEEH